MKSGKKLMRSSGSLSGRVDGSRADGRPPLRGGHLGVKAMNEIIATDNGNGSAALERPTGEFNREAHLDFLLKREEAMMKRSMERRHWVRQVAQPNGYTMDGEGLGVHFNAIILAHRRVHSFIEKDGENEPHTDCYAYGHILNEMRPSSLSRNPQAPRCADCPRMKEGDCRSKYRFVIGAINEARSDDLFLFQPFEPSKGSWESALGWAYNVKGFAPPALRVRVESVANEAGRGMYSRFRFLDEVNDKELAWVTARADRADELCRNEKARKPA